MTQTQIKKSVDVESAEKAFELNLPQFGPYTIDYTRNGRFVALGGRKGHVAAIDWQVGPEILEPFGEICFVASIVNSSGGRGCCPNNNNIKHLLYCVNVKPPTTSVNFYAELEAL